MATGLATEGMGLIDAANMVGTPHAKILRAEEDRLSQIEVAAMLREARGAIEQGDPKRFRATVEDCVKGYHRQVLEGTSNA